jgi:hypothetical protein
VLSVQTPKRGRLHILLSQDDAKAAKTEHTRVRVLGFKPISAAFRLTAKRCATTRNDGGHVRASEPAAALLDRLPRWSLHGMVRRC